MPSRNLRDDDTVEINIGLGGGVTVANLSDTPTSVFIDYFNGAHFSAITGERKLPVGGSLSRTLVELGHENIRVGVKGQEGSNPIAKVTW
jgi:hypothetical protein